MIKMLTILSLVSTICTSLAHSEEFSPKVQTAIDDAVQKGITQNEGGAFEAAMQRAVLKTDVKVFCSSKGLIFAQNMADAVRKNTDLVPRTSNLTAADLEKIKSNADGSARKYENLCESSVANALNSGLTEQEVIELLKTAESEQ